VKGLKFSTVIKGLCVPVGLSFYSVDVDHGSVPFFFLEFLRFFYL
jgi:hypothetical protein